MRVQPTRPNVILVVWHDLGDWLGCYGRQGVVSPHVDALAVQGAIGTEYFSAAPICCPSRAAMMTGMLPHATGVLGQINRGFDMDRGMRPLPQVLRDAGYATYLVGFSHECQDPHWEGFEHAQRVEDEAKPDLARAIFERHRDDASPFFLTITTQAVHRPFGDAYDPVVAERIALPPYVPDTAESRVDAACLCENIRGADEQFGDVMRALDGSGLAANTLVIFTTDHGVGLPRAKATLYDPGLRIALLMRWPGVIRPGTRIDAMLSNVDLLPTILDLTGVSSPPGPSFHGHSFAGSLTGNPYKERDEVIAEHTYGVMYFPVRGIRTRRYKYILNLEPGAPMIIEPGAIHRYGRDLIERWYSAPLPEEELYDLERDPNEFHNLAADPRHGAIRRQLRTRLVEILRETGDPLMTGPLLDPAGAHTPASHFDHLWSIEDGLFRVDLPPIWQRAPS